MSRRHWLLMSATAVLMLGLGAAHAAPTGSYVFGDVPGFTSTTSVDAISHGGLMVVEGTRNGQYGFWLTDLTTYTPLPELTPGLAQPSGVTDTGTIAGASYVTPGQAANYAFLDIAGTVTRLTPPGAIANHTNALISPSGLVAGVFEDSARQSHGYFYSFGTYTVFDPPAGTRFFYFTGVNDAGQLSGSIGPRGDVQRAFRYSQGAFTLLGPDQASYGDGINASGQVAGRIFTGSQIIGFVATGTSLATASDPRDRELILYGLDDQGHAFGTLMGAPSHSFGFLDTGSGLATYTPPYKFYATPTGIDSKDDIVGFYAGKSGQGQRGYFARFVPAPGMP